MPNKPAESPAVVRERGQMLLRHNKIAPMVDRLIGTEHRPRVG